MDPNGAASPSLALHALPAVYAQTCFKNGSAARLRSLHEDAAIMLQSPGWPGTGRNTQRLWAWNIALQQGPSDCQPSPCPPALSLSWLCRSAGLSGRLTCFLRSPSRGCPPSRSARNPLRQLSPGFPCVTVLCPAGLEQQSQLVLLDPPLCAGCAIIIFMSLLCQGSGLRRRIGITKVKLILWSHNDTTLYTEKGSAS